MLANKVANNVTKAVNAMNSPEVSKEEKKVAMRELVAVLVLLVIVLVLNFVFGPWLWNNVVKRLVPSVGAARWYDTVLLSVLLGLVLPM
jgi:cell division protein FtsB